MFAIATPTIFTTIVVQQVYPKVVADRDFAWQ